MALSALAYPHPLDAVPEAILNRVVLETAQVHLARAEVPALRLPRLPLPFRVVAEFQDAQRQPFSVRQSAGFVAVPQLSVALDDIEASLPTRQESPPTSLPLSDHSHAKLEHHWSIHSICCRRDPRPRTPLCIGDRVSAIP